jgi:hypothetical protein
MKNYLPLLLLATTLLSASCSSPLDEDTPRRRTASSNGNSEPIRPTSVTWAFDLAGGNTTGTLPWGNTAIGTKSPADPILIDTSASAPAVWIDATLQGDGTVWNNSVEVKSLVLHADSLVPGTPVVFNGSPEDGTGARIDLEEQIFGTTTWLPQTFVADGTIPNAEITNVEHDPAAKTFTVTIAIDNIPVRMGPMKMDGTLTIQY